MIVPEELKPFAKYVTVTGMVPDWKTFNAEKKEMEKKLRREITKGSDEYMELLKRHKTVEESKTIIDPGEKNRTEDCAGRYFPILSDKERKPWEPYKPIRLPLSDDVKCIFHVDVNAAMVQTSIITKLIPPKIQRYFDTHPRKCETDCGLENNKGWKIDYTVPSYWERTEFDVKPAPPPAAEPEQEPSLPPPTPPEPLTVFLLKSFKSKIIKDEDTGEKVRDSMEIPVTENCSN